MGTLLLWYDNASGIALTFAPPAGKLSIRLLHAFGQRYEPGVNVASDAAGKTKTLQ